MEEGGGKKKEKLPRETLRARRKEEAIYATTIEVTLELWEKMISTQIYAICFIVDVSQIYIFGSAWPSPHIYALISRIHDNTSND